MNGAQRWTTLIIMYGLFAFVALGALAAVLGYFPDAEPAFRKFAIGVLFVDLAGVCIAVFKTQFAPAAESSIDVNLAFSDAAASPPNWNHEKSEYTILDLKGVEKAKGKVLLTLGPGGWSCRLPLPTESADVARLSLEDVRGVIWDVQHFSPHTITVRPEKREKQP